MSDLLYRINSISILLTDIINTKKLDFKNHSNDLYLLTGAFSPFIFNVITDLLWFKSTTLFVGCPCLTYSSFSLLMQSFGLAEYFLLFHFLPSTDLEVINPVSICFFFWCLS